MDCMRSLIQKKIKHFEGKIYEQDYSAKYATPRKKCNRNASQEYDLDSFHLACSFCRKLNWYGNSIKVI